MGYCMFGVWGIAGLACGLLYVWGVLSSVELQMPVHLWSILNEGNMSGGTFVVPVVYISTERDVSLATLCEGT